MQCVRAKPGSCCKVFLKRAESDLVSYSKAECEGRLHLSKKWYNNVATTQTAGCPLDTSETKRGRTAANLTSFKEPLLGISVYCFLNRWFPNIGLKAAVCFMLLMILNAFTDYVFCS